ncbi:MAG: prepilin peptidase [Cystobacterineae bacterium]|nr:prepilin peptidase [Cystobacterineae bacterium]
MVQLLDGVMGYSWLAVLGLCIGSFLNVVIARLPEGRSLWKPRSACMACQAPIRWFDNIPVFSWLFLKGRCRHCRQNISIQYPLVEFLTSALFLLCLWRFAWTFELFQALILIVFIVPLTFIDAKHWILPFELTLPGIAAGLLCGLFQGWPAFEMALVGALVGFLASRLLEYLGWLIFRKEALGGGDKYLLALLGAFLGWKALLSVLLFASLQGALFGGLKLLLTGRAGPRVEPSPAPSTEPAEPSVETEEAPQPTFLPASCRPGLRFWQRLAFIPYTLFVQPIPDDEVYEEADFPEEEWQPGATNMPFGPWLALAGLEYMLLAPSLTRWLENSSLVWLLIK